MPEYRLSLDFTAANDQQAARLAEAWAGTCAAEYGTVYAGLWLAVGSQPSTHPVDLSAVACEWCGRAIRRVDGAWLAIKAEERGYDALDCEGADSARHNPSATGT